MQIKKHLEICSPNCMQIIEILSTSPAQVRVVGGAIRDKLLNIPSLDVDLITNITPNAVINILRNNSVEVVDTGSQFGTVTVFCEGEKFEITSLREDLQCDGRYSKVKFTKDFKKDAARRDFTINALSYCPKKNIIFDYFNGLEDLKNRRVVFIGDANVRIQEDYLRILRFFRFSCKYAQEIDQKSLDACISNKEGLKKISNARTKSELDVLLSMKNENLVTILNILIQKKILTHIFRNVTKIDSKKLSTVIILANLLEISVENYSFYGIIFFEANNISLNELLMLSFSKKEAKNVLFLVEYFQKQLNSNTTLENIRNFLRSIFIKNRMLYYQSLLITISCIESYSDELLQDRLFLEYLSSCQKLIMPVNGHDIANLGFKGSQISLMLEKIEKEWIATNFLKSKQELLDFSE